jgi:phosphomethylpyrimidine synthase
MQCLSKAASSAEILLDGDHASQVRDYAAKLAEKEPLSSSDLASPAEAGFAKAGAVEQARKQGIVEMSAKFRALGAEVYVEEG